jgi:hypothetical protein
VYHKQCNVSAYDVIAKILVLVTPEVLQYATPCPWGSGKVELWDEVS